MSAHENMLRQMGEDPLMPADGTVTSDQFAALLLLIVGCAAVAVIACMKVNLWLS